MSRTLRPLIGALGASLLMHLLPFVDVWPAKPRAQATEVLPLQARLTSQPIPMSSPEFILPEPEAMTPGSVDTPPERKSTAIAKGRKTWTQAIEEQFSAQQREGLFYPEAAIQQGLEGNVLVLLLVDEHGEVVAARVEQSSGHPLLDDAAVRAVRRLRALPGDVPIESLLSVSFSLH